MECFVTNKELKKKRILIYFIEAAQRIMETNDLEGITLRSVADLAGYNSATLYNYFKDLDHLILFASLKYFKSYNLECIEKLPKLGSEKERFFEMWRLFCNNSCKYPKAFYKIFFSKHSQSLNSIIKEYYEIFPEDIEITNNGIYTILSSGSLFTRNKIILEKFFIEEKLDTDKIELINEMTIALYHDLLIKRVNSSVNCQNCDRFVTKMIDYINFLVY